MIRDVTNGTNNGVAHHMMDNFLVPLRYVANTKQTVRRQPFWCPATRIVSIKTLPCDHIFVFCRNLFLPFVYHSRSLQSKEIGRNPHASL